MKSFIPVVKLGRNFWSNDRNVWESVHPGWWGLMERTFAGEFVFDPPINKVPYMIVNVPDPGTDRDPMPGLRGTLDFWQGTTHVNFHTVWGAAVDLVPEGTPYLERERLVTRIRDWFSARHGFRGGCPSSTERMVFGAGASVFERVNAPNFQTLMDTIAEFEVRLRHDDAEARLRFRADLGFAPDLPSF